MKQPSLIKLTGLVLVTVLSSVIARADVPIFENKISLYGYAAGSLAFQQDKFLRGIPSDTASPFALDAAKLGAAFDFDPVTAKLSVYAPSSRLDSQSNPDNIYLLEANVTYAMRSDTKITFGRFQSSIGYEPFDIPNGSFITAGTGDSMNAPGLNVIPNFQEGLKVEGTFDKYSYGLSFVDSIYNAPSKPFRGDGSLSNGFGFELFGNYHGDNFSGHLSVGYQKRKNSIDVTDTFYDNMGVLIGDGTKTVDFDTDTWIVDIYGEYKVPDSKVTLGLEGVWRSDDPIATQHAQTVIVDGQEFSLLDQRLSAYNNRVNTYFGLAMMKYQFSDPFFLAFRFSAGKKQAQTSNSQTGAMNPDTGLVEYMRPDGVMVLFYKYTMAASYTVNKNVEIRAEGSATDYMKTNIIDPVTRTSVKQISDSFYAGVQVILKF